MTPYYSDGAVTIYHGDCRDVLPGLGMVDLVLTDPPYGVGLTYDAFNDDPDAVRLLVNEVVPMMVAAAPATLITCGVSNIHLYPPPKWVLAWFIPAGSGASPWGFGTWQPILAYGADPYLREGLGRRADSITRSNQGAQTAKDRDNFGHPCPKPMAAWKLILTRGSASEGDVVLDPFMGSGTTLRAAKDLGRKAIGIEISEAYCEIAAKRMGQEVLDFGAAS